MHKLETKDYEKVRELLRPFDYSLSVRAAIEGNNPGCIFVDDPAQPRTALALTGEGTFLAGDPNDPATTELLRTLFKEIFTGTVFPSAEWCITLNVHPEAWASRLPDLVPTHEGDKLLCYHYLCREVKYDWHNHVPEGYTVHRIDRSLVERLTDEVREFSNVEGSSWDSVDSFLAKGVSFCVAYGDTVVSWCTCDCVAGDQIEVGIVTDPAHRRKGLAAVAVAATVECCLDSGFSAVGWHCESDNDGSWKTAEKVGFEREREYTAYYYIFDLANNLAQLGWSCLKRDEYEKTAQYYEQVFALRDDHPDYYYTCAAQAWSRLGNAEMTLKYLNRAIDAGWTAVEPAMRAEAFRFLHSTPEWEAVLARMRDNAS